MIGNELLYRFSAICFLIASFSFLVAGILGEFAILDIIITISFAVNSLTFYILSKKEKTNADSTG